MESVHRLKEICRDVRADIVRMTHAAGSGHPGGSLSAVEAMVTLYCNVMNHRPGEPDWPARDRFFLSKGHACPVIYATMARTGYFPVDELLTLRKCGTRLQGHPSCKTLPGIEVSSGSLGQGLSVANGFALSARIDQKPYRAYCLLGDGELQEGQNWEAAMAAVKFKLDHLIAIVDNNGVQLDGTLEEIMPMGDIGQKFAAFGWNVIAADGHDVRSIDAAIEQAKAVRGMPSVIVAKTVKGKGVSFMEGKNTWHGKAIEDNDYAIAMAELGGDK